MRPEVDFAGRAIQGDRDNQQDFYAFEPLEDGRLLLVLADGAGGQAKGEMASRNAALGFLECFAQARGKTPPTLSDALNHANQRLAEYIDEDPPRRATMATTLLAVLVEGLSFHWISVGDSPLLLFRDGKAVRLNADHSGAGLTGENKLPKNVLRSALVGGRIPLVDWRRDSYPLKEKDILIMASDGLWTLSLEEISAHLSDHASRDASEISSNLMHHLVAKEKKRQDNVTITVIRAGGEPASLPAKTAA
jgi:serine/threonine protein phosphatase PrpC